MTCRNLGNVQPIDTGNGKSLDVNFELVHHIYSMLKGGSFELGW